MILSPPRLDSDGKANTWIDTVVERCTFSRSECLAADMRPRKPAATVKPAATGRNRVATNPRTTDPDPAATSRPHAPSLALACRADCGRGSGGEYGSCAGAGGIDLAARATRTGRACSHPLCGLRTAGGDADFRHRVGERILEFFHRLVAIGGSFRHRFLDDGVQRGVDEMRLEIAQGPGILAS